MSKRTPQSEREQTERKILEALSNVDPLSRANRRLTFTELLNTTSLGRGTLARALDRMEKSDKVLREVIAPPGQQVRIWYRWGTEAAKTYPLRSSRKYYEQLSNKFDPTLAPKKYMEDVAVGLGLTLLPVVIRSIIEKRAVAADAILKEFKFLVGKYLIYRCNPKLDLRQTLKEFTDIEAHPERYRAELDELLSAVKELEQN